MNRKEITIRRRDLPMAPLVLLALVSGPTPGHAGDDPLYGHMARTNRVALLEGSGSQGAWGLSVGAGATALPVATTSPLMEEQLSFAAPTSEGDTQVLPKAWIVKGTPWPVNLGAMGGVAPAGRLTQAALFAQWTLLEKPRLPAVALRGTTSRLNGLRSSTMTSHGLALQISHGWAYLTGFLGAGGVHHAARVDHEETDDRQWSHTTYNAGLQWILVPPFVRIAVESIGGGGPPTVAGKLAIGL